MSSVILVVLGTIQIIYFILVSFLVVCGFQRIIPSNLVILFFNYKINVFSYNIPRYNFDEVRIMTCSSFNGTMELLTY